MLKHKLLQWQDMEYVIPTIEINACVNLAYQLAMEQDRSKWLITINSGIKRCLNDFFKAVAPKMHEIGAGDAYFDIHVGADEHHSIMGMDYIEPQDPESPRGRDLIAKGLEGISLWAAMLYSWISIEMFPYFLANHILIFLLSSSLNRRSSYLVITRQRYLSSITHILSQIPGD